MAGNTERISVRVQPKASKNAVEPLPDAPDGQRCFKVNVTTVPENGKANSAVIKLLSKHLGIAKSSISLVAGDKHRDKVFEIPSA